MLSDLTLTFITCGKNAKNRKTAYQYKLEVECQPQAVFVYDSQTKEVLLHEIRIGYTTTCTTMNNIPIATDFQHRWQKYFTSLHVD